MDSVIDQVNMVAYPEHQTDDSKLDTGQSGVKKETMKQEEEVKNQNGETESPGEVNEILNEDEGDSSDNDDDTSEDDSSSSSSSSSDDDADEQNGKECNESKEGEEKEGGKQDGEEQNEGDEGEKEKGEDENGAEEEGKEEGSDSGGSSSDEERIPLHRKPRSRRDGLRLQSKRDNYYKHRTVTDMVRICHSLSDELKEKISLVVIVRDRRYHKTAYKYGGVGELLDQLEQRRPFTLPKTDVVKGKITKDEAFSKFAPKSKKIQGMAF